MYHKQCLSPEAIAGLLATLKHFSLTNLLLQFLSQARHWNTRGIDLVDLKRGQREHATAITAP